MEERLLRRRDVVQRVGLSAVTINRLEAAGDFPARRHVGTNSVAWLASEVERWMRGRPRRKTVPQLVSPRGRPPGRRRQRQEDIRR